MARAPSPYYRDPAADIGQSLATALFGNPQAAAQQAQLQAQMEERQAQAREADAHAGLYGAQRQGIDTQNVAAQSLPTLFAAMQPKPRAAPPETLDGFLAPDYQPAPAQTPEVAFRQGLPALLAAMTQTQGDKVSPSETVGTLASFLGGDEMARRGLIAQGHSPTADFAVTPERADDIAGIANAAELAKATGVATINHATDIPIANIRAGADRDVAGINHANDIPVANIAAGSRENVAGIKAGSNSLGSMIGSMYPSARITSEDRTQASQDGLRARGATSATHSYHVPGNGGSAVDMAPIPGKTLSQFVGELTANGAKVIEAKDETAPGQGTGPHWHIAVQANAAKGKAGAAPKAVSGPNMKMIVQEIAAQLPEGLAPQAAILVRKRAAELFQQTGNATGAVQQALTERRAEGHAINARKSGNAAPVPGARKAPDGKWYVSKGKNADGSPKYYEVN